MAVVEHAGQTGAVTEGKFGDYFISIVLINNKFIYTLRYPLNKVKLQSEMQSKYCT